MSVQSLREYLALSRNRFNNQRDRARSQRISIKTDIIYLIRDSKELRIKLTDESFSSEEIEEIRKKRSELESQIARSKIKLDKLDKKISDLTLLIEKLTLDLDELEGEL